MLLLRTDAATDTADDKTESLGGPHEKRLLNDLLANYNVLERPVANESEPLLLSFGLMLQQIIDVVRFLQNFTTVSCMPYYSHSVDAHSYLTRTPSVLDVVYCRTPRTFFMWLYITLTDG
ncbi:nicotinic acetylcholine receptor [Tropilaelaps mercedesae]|uniref:Nicotinic acetylcholine receptor n=1 Tax=Tropilaelaps mercedesae TaxID=418985 RepID=A0A1V9WZ94_9ACAR|nr:nicotinic acetylcholine receptor [Tropilaelaps mercedesae]